MFKCFETGNKTEVSFIFLLAFIFASLDAKRRLRVGKDAKGRPKGGADAGQGTGGCKGSKDVFNVVWGYFDIFHVHGSIIPFCFIMFSLAFCRAAKMIAIATPPQ